MARTNAWALLMTSPLSTTMAEARSTLDLVLLNNSLVAVVVDILWLLHPFHLHILHKVDHPIHRRMVHHPIRLHLVHLRIHHLVHHPIHLLDPDMAVAQWACLLWVDHPNLLQVDMDMLQVVVLTTTYVDHRLDPHSNLHTAGHQAMEVVDTVNNKDTEVDLLLMEAMVNPRIPSPLRQVPISRINLDINRHTSLNISSLLISPSTNNHSRQKVVEWAWAAWLSQEVRVS